MPNIKKIGWICIFFNFFNRYIFSSTESHSSCYPPERVAADLCSLRVCVAAPEGSGALTERGGGGGGTRGVQSGSDQERSAHRGSSFGGRENTVYQRRERCTCCCFLMPLHIIIYFAHRSEFLQKKKKKWRGVFLKRHEGRCSRRPDVLCCWFSCVW